MGAETTSKKLTGGADPPGSAPPTGPPGRRIVVAKAIARVARVAVAVLAVGLFVASLPAVFEDLATACGGPSCADGRLGPGDARDLRDLGVSLEAYALYGVAQQVAWAFVWCAVGVCVFWRKPDNPMALVSGLTLVTLGATFTNAPQALARSAPAWELPVAFVTFVGQACFILFLFPDGRFAPRWTRFLAAGAVAAAYAPAYLLPGSPLGLDRWPPALTLISTAFLFVAAVGAQVYRHRRVSGATQRRQTRWVVFGLAVSLGGFVGLILVGTLSSETPDGPLSDVAFNTAIFLLMLPIPLSIGVAVLRHRLWDIDLVINRALVYATLTVLVVGIYVLVVGYLGALLRTEDNLLVSLVATGLVAVLFQPMRGRLQRGVNRLMYGQRDDPYAVLSGMGERLEATLAPDAVLPAIVETVREALKLPYAAVALPRNGSFEVAAASGEPATRETLLLPLTYGGETVGRLLLSPRVGEDGFSAADRRLVHDLARHAGMAVHGVRAMNDLRRSREGLVLAREEERRRLRRDLHDELDPTRRAWGS